MCGMGIHDHEGPATQAKAEFLWVGRDPVIRWKPGSSGESANFRLARDSGATEIPQSRP